MPAADHKTATGPIIGRDIRELGADVRRGVGAEK
jgi:hypothetical protein